MTVPPIVFDVGCETTRCGFASSLAGGDQIIEQYPSAICVGQNAQLRLSKNAPSYEFVEPVGPLALQYRQRHLNARLVSPMEESVVTDFERFSTLLDYGYHRLKARPRLECMWAHAPANFSSEQGCINLNTFTKQKWETVASEHPVVMAFAVPQQEADLEKITQFMFEHVNVRMFCLSPAPVLDLLSEGLTSGMVVHLGAGRSSIVPVCEGKVVADFSLPVKLPSAADVGAELAHLLGATTGLDRCAVRALVKSLGCYVADSSFQDGACIPGIDESLSPDTSKYTLPDGKQVTVGTERFRAPEIIFSERAGGWEFPGLTDQLVSCISKIQNAPLLSSMSQVAFLTGGICNLPGLQSRLQREVGQHTTIKRASDPQLSTWRGGAMLAQHSAFLSGEAAMKMYEYEETGPAIVRQHLFGPGVVNLDVNPGSANQIQ